MARCPVPHLSNPKKNVLYRARPWAGIFSASSVLVALLISRDVWRHTLFDQI
jgi:hypothetical protein